MCELPDATINIILHHICTCVTNRCHSLVADLHVLHGLSRDHLLGHIATTLQLFSVLQDS